MKNTLSDPRTIEITGQIDASLCVEETADETKLNFINSGSTYRLLRFEKQTIFKSKWIVLAPGDNVIPFKNKAAKLAEDEFFILEEDGKGGFNAPDDYKGGPVIIRPPFGT